jgi:nicotinate-nucleotide adenylyltransferase
VISERFDARIDDGTPEAPFRLGILGGTFDPVHVGHLHIAQCALEQFSLEGVLFITTGIPIRKIENGFSDAEDRFAMVKAAVSDNECFDASRVELDRAGDTYTIDTLRSIHERYGSRAELFFIAGFDAATDMDTWKDADEIAELVTVLCAGRRASGHDGEKAAEAEALQPKNRTGFTIKHLDTLNLDISSQELRSLLKEGYSAKYLIPSAALEYITEHGLYR